MARKSTITKAKLLQLQKRFKVDAAIGNYLGVSRQAIHQLRQKYHIKKIANPKADRNKKIVALYKKRCRVENTTHAIAWVCVEYNLSVSQVYRILKRNA